MVRLITITPIETPNIEISVIIEINASFLRERRYRFAILAEKRIDIMVPLWSFPLGFPQRLLPRLVALRLEIILHLLLIVNWLTT